MHHLARAAAFLTLFVLLAPSVAAEERNVPVGEVVEAVEGDVLRWAWTNGTASVMAVPNAEGLELHRPNRSGEWRVGGGGQSISSVNPEDGIVQVEVVRGSGRLLLLEPVITIRTVDGVSTLEARGEVPQGGCRAVQFSDSFFDSTPSGPLVVEAVGVDLTLRLMDRRLNVVEEAEDVLSHDDAHHAFQNAIGFTLVMQACAPDDGDGGPYLFRVTRTLEPAERADAPFVPLALVALAVSGAAIWRGRDYGA